MASFQGVPSWRDPRWGQTAALATFCVLGQTVLDFKISPLEVLVSLFTCVGVDLTLTRIRRHQMIVPLSGIITGLGMALLLRSAYPAVFVVAGVLAIGSKHVITVRGRHRFNPTNFGLVVTLAFTQGGVAMVTPGQWGRSSLILFAILCAGVLVVFRAERLALVSALVAFQVVFFVIFHGGSLDVSAALSGAVLTFAFFMITDPKTAPSTRARQVVYAAFVALLGQVFAALGSMDGPFIALFVVCAAMPVLERSWLAGPARSLRPQGLATGA
ncbi:MAG: RnfABCDGE type electron transport complex subunit D [Actinomycetota bacterium]|nr:RnfABCDGE type electron transport complex subunit D [Actinomycetota bacterium]